MTPLLKWVGGKTKLLPEIKTHMPRNFSRYFEPFFGGGALFFDLEPKQAVISDANSALMETYMAIRDDPQSVSDALDKLRPLTDEESYYRVRGRFNERMRTVRLSSADAATFLYLNRTGFNGLYRENAHGDLNVAWGKRKSPAPHPDFSTLSAASQLLKQSYLRCDDFATAVEDAGPGDFVYVDPPYHPLNETSAFTKYTGDGFSIRTQRRLAELVHSLRSRGVYVLASNSDTPFTRDLYSDFEIVTVERCGSVNSDASKRGPVGEILVVAKPKHELIDHLFDVSDAAEVTT